MHFGGLTSVYLEASSWLQTQVPLLQSKPDFDWDEVTAHRQLEYQPCFGDFQCARLQVPMDWQGGSAEDLAGKTVEIAVIKVEATVPVTDPTYGGAVVLNPGGPGGSGVNQVLKIGHNVRTILSAGLNSDNSTAKNFDIIGFDPRGINNTRPALVCTRNHIEEAIGMIAEQSYGMMASSNTSFDNLWARYRATAEGCSRRLARQGIGKHVTTAAVARDIIEIFERHGEWREKEARQLLQKLPNQLYSSDEERAVIDRVSYNPGEEKVQYWGFSYGTILGATLTAMFPERIHRAVLDGVSDSFDYMRGDYATDLVDTDALWPRMAEHCHRGGPANCPMYVDGGPEAITAKMEQAFAELRHNPIAVPETSSDGPEIVTYDDLKMNFVSMAYNPLRFLPETAQIIQDVSNRNGSTLAKWKINQRPANLGQPLSEKCRKDGPFSPSCFPRGAQTLAPEAIMCTDASPTRLNQTKEEYREYADMIRGQSRIMGEAWAVHQMACTAWHVRPHWRYDGDFHNKTAHPILFAGNTADPVTPLGNAFSMGKGFDGAGILQQNTEGHCTIAGISLCSGRAIRHYFQTGELPGKIGGLDNWSGYGAFCEPDRLPFDGYGPGGDTSVPEGEKDEALWKALVGLNMP